MDILRALSGNRRYLLFGIIVLVVGNPAPSQKTHEASELPDLNTVRQASLRPSYSCRSDANFSRGYEGTALFLSSHSKQSSSPELLFNGACGAENYFDVNTAGDSLSLIADLGADVTLGNMTAQMTFNRTGVNSWPAYTPFARRAKIVPGHTYAVVINTVDQRALFVFTVDNLVPDVEVDLRFEVKDYQLNLGQRLRSAGFDWNQ